ncbi:MAG: hypothetical protein IPK20_21985 [Betaproteobacteria bacterium]|nr:hypothetical protein [Betaproteobacteria bacterium]
MSLMKSVYNASPRALRSLYTNAYGLRNRARYRRWDQLLRGIAYTETLARSDQIALVDDKLKLMIRHAIANVPFYAQYQRLEADLKHRSAYEVLKELPITNKEIINRDPAASWPAAGAIA